VPPWVTERVEEKIMYKPWRTPILPPIPPGYRPLCEDPPDQYSIMKVMPRVVRGVPYFYEEHWSDMDFVVEKLVDVVDPPRFYPLVGPAQLHHCHWKCTVYYTEVLRSDYPFPFYTKRRRTQVIMMDRDHLHIFAASAEQAQGIARDFQEARP
jgi:hypothetical protein